MTDPTDPPGPTGPDEPVNGGVDALDALASAHLDGEVTSEGIDATDATLRARVAELRTVADRVADVGPAPSGVADAAVAAALVAYDEAALDAPQHGARATPASSEEPASLEERRAGRVDRPAWQRIPVGAVAAAAAVVLVAVVGVVGLTASDDPDEDTATAALESAEAGRAAGVADGADEAAAEAPAAALDAAGDATDDMADEGGDIGRTEAAADMAPDSSGATATRRDFASVDELADTLAAQLESSGSTSSDADEESEEEVRLAEDPCDAASLAEVDPDDVVLLRDVSLEGRDATALVHGPDGERQLVVVDDATCEVVADRPLTG